MGRTKELQIEIQATMAADIYENIPEEIRDQMKIKRIEAANWRDTYKKDPIWKCLQDEMIEAVKKRGEREAEIRAGI